MSPFVRDARKGSPMHPSALQRLQANDSRAHQRISMLDDPIDGGDRFTEAMQGGAIDLSV